LLTYLILSRFGSAVSYSDWTVQFLLRLSGDTLYTKAQNVHQLLQLATREVMNGDQPDLLRKSENHYVLLENGKIRGNLTGGSSYAILSYAVFLLTKAPNSHLFLTL
jgi:hypothetical protein